MTTLRILAAGLLSCTLAACFGPERLASSQSVAPAPSSSASPARVQRHMGPGVDPATLIDARLERLLAASAAPGALDDVDACGC
jgi:hypothetical protein